jgi:hypothetical protein
MCAFFARVFGALAGTATLNNAFVIHESGLQTPDTRHLTGKISRPTSLTDDTTLELEC